MKLILLGVGQSFPLFQSSLFFLERLGCGARSTNLLKKEKQYDKDRTLISEMLRTWTGPVTTVISFSIIFMNTAAVLQMKIMVQH